jgi:prepilin-type N-terminal cleavage/methylation domain-containing protein
MTIFSAEGYVSHRRFIERQCASGFSLIEIAVVLVILSILLAVVAVPLATQVTQRKVLATQFGLESAQKALLAFAAANGRLPCPATDGAAGTSNSLGDESFASGSSALDGVCARFVGFLPAVALGLSPVDSEGFLTDGWGVRQNRVRYAVWGSSTTPINSPYIPSTVFYPFTKTNGMKDARISNLGDTNNKFLFVCQSAPTGILPTASSAPSSSNACGASVKLTDKSPAVIFSLGANAATGGTGADELHNVNQDFVFVSHDSTSVGSTAGEFDDIVTWISLNILFDRMLQAQRLP